LGDVGEIGVGKGQKLYVSDIESVVAIDHTTKVVLDSYNMLIWAKANFLLLEVATFLWVRLAKFELCRTPNFTLFIFVKTIFRFHLFDNLSIFVLYHEHPQGFLRVEHKFSDMLILLLLVLSFFGHSRLLLAWESKSKLSLVLGLRLIVLRVRCYLAILEFELEYVDKVTSVVPHLFYSDFLQLLFRKVRHLLERGHVGSS